MALTATYYGRALARVGNRIIIRHGDSAEQPFVIDTCVVETWFPSVGSPISSAIALNGKHGECRHFVPTAVTEHGVGHQQVWDDAQPLAY